MFSLSSQKDRQGKRAEAAVGLYSAIVGQARRPAFYRDFGVPDSLDGRFDLILLHVCLVLRRLKGDRDIDEELGQALFDTLFLDMDQSLREMGVGDLGVGKRVKRMVQAFYGRLAAYEDGLASGEGRLEEALRRNLYGTVSAPDEGIATLADYVRRQAASLAGQPSADLMAGRVDFLPPPESVERDGPALAPSSPDPAAESR